MLVSSAESPSTTFSVSTVGVFTEGREFELGSNALRYVSSYARRLLIDCEEDRTIRAVLVGMLREGYRNAWRRHVAAKADESAQPLLAPGRRQRLLV
jgi:hypothetical protein